MSKTYKDVCDTEEQIRAQKNKNQQYRQQILDVDREIDAMVLKIDTYRALKLSELSKFYLTFNFIILEITKTSKTTYYIYMIFNLDTITEQKKLLEEKQTKVEVIQEEESNGVIEVPVPEQFSPEK